jgi:hypothetical protein
MPAWQSSQKLVLLHSKQLEEQGVQTKDEI